MSDKRWVLWMGVNGQGEADSPWNNEADDGFGAFNWEAYPSLAAALARNSNVLIDNLKPAVGDALVMVANSAALYTPGGGFGGDNLLLSDLYIAPAGVTVDLFGVDFYGTVTIDGVSLSNISVNGPAAVATITNCDLSYGGVNGGGTISNCTGFLNGFGGLPDSPLTINSSTLTVLSGTGGPITLSGTTFDISDRALNGTDFTLAAGAQLRANASTTLDSGSITAANSNILGGTYGASVPISLNNVQGDWQINNVNATFNGDVTISGTCTYFDNSFASGSATVVANATIGGINFTGTAPVIKAGVTATFNTEDAGIDFLLQGLSVGWGATANLVSSGDTPSDSHWHLFADVVTKERGAVKPSGYINWDGHGVTRLEPLPQLAPLPGIGL